MQKRFWINRIQVDLARNQIIRDGEEFSLQPKILAVLRILALNQGNVVSHDQLMDEVWEDATVSPNTLQRCIAQLRKALGDDSRSQQVIKTHSKQGYSLETHVSWDDSSTELLNGSNESESTLANSSSNKSLYLTAGIAALVIVALLAFLYPVEEPLSYQSIRQLTSSDEKEYNPNYSPNGRYMVFHRYLGVCENHIWAKDLTTNQEIQLTKSPGIYGAHSWSADGNQLAFIKQENCQSTENPMQACWRLQTLDFAAALQSPMETRERLDCDQSYSTYPVWMNDGSILLLKQHAGKLRLMVYDARSTDLVEFYHPEIGELYDYDYSPAKNQLMVMTRVGTNEYYMEHVDANGQLVNRNRIQPLESTSVFQKYYAGFHPSGDFLITKIEDVLYKLSLNGELSPIKTPDNVSIATPYFHPTENKIVATSGKVDLDIARIDLSKFGSEDITSQRTELVSGVNRTILAYPSIARSTRSEEMARFNPVNESVAFLSERSGSPQVWLLENEQTKQLTRFESNSRIRGMQWSPDGSRIAIGINDGISVIEMNGKVATLELDANVNELLQWIDSDLLLVLYDSDKTNQLANLNIANGQFSDTTQSDIKWAKKYKDLFILQKSDRTLWRLSKDDSITKLPFEQSILTGKPVVLSNDNLYGISNTDKLWRFDLETDQFELLGPIGEHLWWVMDKKGDILLAAQGVSARKEIVELIGNAD